MDELSKRIADDQAEIIAKRSEARRLRERASRMEEEADEIERLLQLARLQRS